MNRALGVSLIMLYNDSNTIDPNINQLVVKKKKKKNSLYI